MQSMSVLKGFAVLFSLLAISNMLKPLQLSDDVGFVLLGQRLDGTANQIAGPLFGLFLAVYAMSIFAMKTYALPLGMAYAVYVIVNLTMWNFRMPEGAETSLLFGLAYSAIAVGVSSGASYLLWQNKDALS
jgi:hypothetical protein